MINLQTKIPLEKQPHNQIDYNSKILLLGSCFSENIGYRFSYFKFQSTINPFGILFHPLAIETLIIRAINKDYYVDSEVKFNNEQYYCLDAHSKLNSNSKKDLLKSLNSQIDHTNKHLKEVSHLIITLGTSWVYRHIATDTVVANCHKIPQKQFIKELLSVEDISESLQAIISLVREVNPNIKIVFTVSPVRHLKDGFVENSQSKAHLISAVQGVVDPRQQQYYFPSYELQMDELRDYRFYAEDMIHPNELAIDYIWERFKTVWFTDQAIATSEEILKIQKGLAHKPFNEKSEAHKAFLKNLQVKITQLQHQYSHIVF